MANNILTNISHPSGEQSPVEDSTLPPGINLDSFGGPIHVEWDRETAMTPLGQLPFFIDFLKTSGLFDALVADCPLRYASPNAPKKRDVLGTRCCRCLLGTDVTLTSLRCAATVFCPSF